MHSSAAATTPGGSDNEWLWAVNNFARRTPWLHSVVYDYAIYGGALFAVLLFAGWWAVRRRGDPTRMAAAMWAAVATVGAVAIDQPIAHSAHEQRPYDAISGLLVLAHRTGDPSFPSDYGVMAGAAAAGLFLVSHRLGEAGLAVGVLLAFSRVYIAADYPHDVITGLALGAAITLVGWVPLRRPLTGTVAALAATAARPLLNSRSSSRPS